MSNALYIILLFVLLFSTSSCSQSQTGSTDRIKTKNITSSLPSIPVALSEPEERAIYLVMHYWDNFDFSDTTLISKPKITEQAFVDFINILPRVPFEKAKTALTTFIDSASANTSMFVHFIELSEKYLDDPNSPLRNEDYYIPILRYIVASPKLDEVNKVRQQYQLEQALKNRPGDVAADFSYTLADSRTFKMSSVKADYTVLYINNPNCLDCKRVKEYISGSSLFRQMSKSGRLVVLAVYPDADIPLWKNGNYPKMMINGYDAGQVINKKQLYNLRAIPMLYLLDKDKRVILKDTTVEHIEEWLMQNV